MQYRVLAGELIPEVHFLEHKSDLVALVNKEDHSFSLAGAPIDHVKLKGFSAAVKAVGGFVPTPLTPNGPLCVQIRHVYTGKYPKGGFLKSDEQPMVLTSALKDYATYAPATRAVNFLTRVEAHKALTTPSATEAGTPIVAYYPAVVADSLTLTLDMAFDGFDESLVAGIGNAFKDLGGLPIFATIGGYLIAGGSLIKLAGDTADRLIDGTPKFSQTVELNFRPENGPVIGADLRVVCNNSFDPSGYRYDFGKGLISKTGDKVYDGDEPYIVLLIDGAERESLKNFAPTAITAAQLDKFFGAKPGAEVAIDGLVGAMKLWNDFTYREQADAVAKKMADSSLSADQKKVLKDKFDALVKNIQSDELKPK